VAVDRDPSDGSDRPPALFGRSAGALPPADVAPPDALDDPGLLRGGRGAAAGAVDGGRAGRLSPIRGFSPPG
jgi:hypothetical protein